MEYLGSTYLQASLSIAPNFLLENYVIRNQIQTETRTDQVFDSCLNIFILGYRNQQKSPIFIV